MLKIDTIFLFLFIFSVLTVLITIVKFLRAVSQKNPKPIFKNDTDLIYLGLIITYIITYLIQT